MKIFDSLEHIVRENELLAPYTWLRLGGAAQYFAEPTSIDELRMLVERCRDEEMQVRVLGGGSNLLVRDEGVAGLVVHLAAPAFAKICVEGRTLTAGGGAKLGHVISTSVRESLGGLESLVGIPGVVGGALRSNAAAHGTDIGHWTHQATVMTRTAEIRNYAREDLRFSYRSSNLDELAILEAQFVLETTEIRELTSRMQKLWITRKSSQPLCNQNTVNVFANPSWTAAGSLIEQTGLKGARVGEAEICDRDANFIVANPGASSRDVLRLIDLMRSTVSEQLGVELELALEIW